MNQPLAFVHPSAKIANNVIIEPFACIDKNVEIGEGTWIGPHTTMLEGARIGKICKIFPGAVIAAIPQDLKFKGEVTTAEIGDNTMIRECVTVSRGTASKGKTIIGSNCLIMAYCHVAHDCVVGNNVILVNGATLAGEVVVDDYAILSANTLVHQFCHIGAHTMFAGNSLVGKDVPPFIRVAHNPLSYSGVNSIGLRRRGFTNEMINNIQDVYRVLFNKGLNVTQAVEYIENELAATKERDEIILFISNSTRGIIKGIAEKE